MYGIVFQKMRFLKTFLNKAIDPNDMPSPKADVAVIMSMLEIHIPPSFFNVISRLVQELELCGHVHTW